MVEKCEEVIELNSLECPVCFNLMLIPILLPCKHTLCIECCERIVYSENIRCPMDRANFEKNSLLLNKPLFEAFISTRIEDFKKLGKEYAEVKLKKPKFKMLGIHYGNEHTLLSVDPDIDNKHYWTAFIRIAKLSPEMNFDFQKLREEANIENILGISSRINSDFEGVPINTDGNEKIEDYVESVFFELDETFMPPTVNKKAPPFEIGRRGWGEFEIIAELKFKSHLGLPKATLKINLNFEQSTTQLLEIIRID